FPHKETVSVGAYSPQAGISAAKLKRNLLHWAAERGFQLGKLSCRAGWINYDYRGYCFDPVWLVGDAAGLTSGLSGEGIYPAVVSGETVARRILDPSSGDGDLAPLIRKHRQHLRLVKLSRLHPTCSFLLMEMVLLLIRSRLLRFQAIEMASAS
ncbi:MAG: NAD(P)/FAD-dependent oxidoreductase, partial [Candidatus Electrothrix sp. ATG2]|nr:NAD(P)/FAD-dependent oxidoreductase [Candidatus Electrothrix sp. ATG2]